jgi:hypothetical protein
MAISELSHVRTEFAPLLIVPSLSHHPVQTNCQSPGHRYFGGFPSLPHHQVEILAALFWHAARCGVDTAPGLASPYGPGALVGLPATLTRRNYSMTATVTHDAELGFLTTQVLESLLREHPELCGELLEISSAKLAHTEQVTKALLRKEKLPKVSRKGRPCLLKQGGSKH